MTGKGKQLKCGQCGQEKHIVFLAHHSYVHHHGEILIECTECGSISEVKLTEPKIIIQNYDGLGTICASE